jgi:hypothetical protein
MMTTFTTEDREALEKGLEFYKALKNEKDGSVTINVEPIPFMGLVTLTDDEDREQMLRDQLKVLQAENRRLRKKLMEHGDND